MVAARPWCWHIMGAPQNISKDADLIGSLIRTDTPEFSWSVSRKQNQWNPTVVSL
jgi:hypothetical protein